MRPTTLLGLALMALVVSGQAFGQASAVAPCAVRIVSPASAGYDVSTEMMLRGTVVDLQNGSLKLRLAAGTVRVELSATASTTLSLGQSVEVTASKITGETGQHFVAREVRVNGETLVLRNANGVPVV